MDRSQQQFLQRSPQAVLMTDKQQRILQINPAFSQISGYNIEDVLGESLDCLGGDEFPESSYADIFATAARIGNWQGEVRQRHKEGSIYHAWLNAVALEDEQGELNGFIVQFFNLNQIQSQITSPVSAAQYDELTRLPNWDMFQDILAKRMEQSRAQGEKLAVMLVDLDRFKWINDNLGRNVGDNLLQEVARRLGGVVRGDDALARLSSDEFVMMIPLVDDIDSALKVAQRVVDQLSHGIFVEHREIFISGSVGISVYPDHAERPKDLVKKADVAMYAAKQGGRNTFRVYSELMERSKGPQILREEDLTSALVSGAIQMSYLPVYNIHSHQVVAVHARPIWQHTELGQIPFADFSGLLQSPESLDHYEQWLDQEIQGLDLLWQRFPKLRFISFRLEAQQLQNKAAVQRWLAQLSVYQKQGRYMLDVDLNTALEYEGELFDLLTTDTQLSVSGFACGSPSVQQLREIQPDLIKLDGDLVMAMTNDEARQKIVENVIDIAAKLDIEVLADGVGTAGTRAQLTAHGCMLMQGRYFGAPLSLQQILDHLAVEH